MYIVHCTEVPLNVQKYMQNVKKHVTSWAYVFEVYRKLYYENNNKLALKTYNSGIKNVKLCAVDVN